MPVDLGPLATGTAAFLRLLGPLISIVNPLSGALVFGVLTSGMDIAHRRRMGWQVGLSAAAILLVALGAGGPIVIALGVDLDALRVAGGLLLVATAWDMLRGRTRQPGGMPVSGLFPLTVPITVGPATIALVITAAPAQEDAIWPTGLGQVGAIVVVCLVVAFAYSRVDWLFAHLSAGAVGGIRNFGAVVLLVLAIETGAAGIRSLLGV